MGTRVSPPPDRFEIHRVGEPDRLAPPPFVPASPEHGDNPEAPAHSPGPAETPERVLVPAGRA